MNRRTAIITALPLAIVAAFGLVGVFASRAGDGDRPRADSVKSDLPFAIAEPVKARWEAGRSADAAFTFDVAAPNTDVAESLDLTRQKILFDGRNDVRIGPSRSVAPDFAFLVNNGSRSERVVIDGLNASDCTEYGGYVFGARDWWIRNTTLHQAADASQHGLRIATGERVRISDTVIDTRGGHKTSLWVLHGDRIELRNVKLVGCSSIFSIDPANPDLPDGQVTNVVIADCWIDLHEDQAWAHPLDFQPGVENVTITNLHVRGFKQPLNVWSSINGVPQPRNVRWKDIWIPAPGQPADTPFDEVEWVKLRDDDYTRIVWHRDRTLDEIKADGVGPLEP